MNKNKGKNKKPLKSGLNFYKEEKNILDVIKWDVLFWNNEYPLDKWWREKYNIPFGSTQHKEMDFIRMRFEFEEDKVFTKVIEKYKKSKKSEKIKYKDIEGNDVEYVNHPSGVIEMTQSEILKEFDNLDLDKY